MAWSALETRWRSLVGGQALAQPSPPFEVVTPAEPWVYAAISDPLPPVGVDYAIKVRVRAFEADIGVCLTNPHGSALLSAEARIGPGAGETQAAFRLDPANGPACLLIRKLSEDDSIGRIMVLEVFSAPAADIDEPLLGPSNDNPPMPQISPACVARADEPMWPVCIGNTCEAKVQVSRVLQFRRKPDTSQAAFRLMMLPPRSADTFGWDLFDWQGTPFNALCTYLREDFNGLLERDELWPNEIGVMHRRLGTEHLHDFEQFRKKGDPAYTEAMVDQGYAAARAHFDQMAEDFRRRLTTPGPYLYIHVCEDIPNERNVRQLIQLLSARSPEHRFHLLFVGFEDEDSDLSNLSDQVSKAYRPRPPAGVIAMDWEGDYAAWDKALAPFNLLLPAEPLPAPVPPEPQSQPRRGLLARLFAR